LGFFIIFLVSVIFLGLMLSSIVKDEILALDIAFFYNSPAFVFSGFTFPIFAMPIFDKLYAQFIPYTHFLYGFFKLAQMNTPARYARPEVLALFLFIAIGFVGSVIALCIRTKKILQKTAS
jgi:ABC-2 type transporter.